MKRSKGQTRFCKPTRASDPSESGNTSGTADSTREVCAATRRCATNSRPFRRVPPDRPDSRARETQQRSKNDRTHLTRSVEICRRNSHKRLPSVWVWSTSGRYEIVWTRSSRPFRKKDPINYVRRGKGVAKKSASDFHRDNTPCSRGRVHVAGENRLLAI